VKIDEKKGNHPIYHLVRIYGYLMLFKPMPINYFKGFSSIFMQDSGINNRLIIMGNLP
jgi:hypothetical protein